MKCITKEDFEQYSGILVLGEVREGQLTDSSVELVSEAKRIAAVTGEKVTALVVGENVTEISKKLAGYGADKVIVCNNALLANYTTTAYTKVVCEVVEQEKPDIFLIGATTAGRDLAPRCAARLVTGLNADCTFLHAGKESYMKYLAENSSLDLAAMDSKVDEKSLKMTMPAFGGHMMATIICPEYRPQMATVRPGVMLPGEFDAEKAAACVPVVYDCALTEADLGVAILEVLKNSGSTVDLTKAEVIVSVGHGIQADVQKGLALANELCELLGGTIGCSRDVSTEGWVEEERMIGQTGKIVRPKLYIALGISGAIQHIGGMKDSGYIVAINKDKNAPIFAEADVCIVGDLFDVVPKLIADIKKAKA